MKKIFLNCVVLSLLVLTGVAFADSPPSCSLKGEYNKPFQCGLSLGSEAIMVVWNKNTLSCTLVSVQPNSTYTYCNPQETPSSAYENDAVAGGKICLKNGYVVLKCANKNIAHYDTTIKK